MAAEDQNQQAAQNQHSQGNPQPYSATGYGSGTTTHQSPANPYSEDAYFSEAVKKIIKEDQNRFSIFTIAFTFISLNIQVFSKVESLNVAILLIIIIFIYHLGLAYLLINPNEEKDRIVLGMIVLALATVLGMFLITPNQSFSPTDKEKTEQRIKTLENKIEVLQYHN